MSNYAAKTTRQPSLPAKRQPLSAIIITAGFKETGQEGAALEEEISHIIQSSGLRIIGPNCLGIMRPATGLNATFLTSMALPGNVGFISQSGAMCAAILDWSLRERMGFSAFISIGSMLDVNWGDLIYELGDDPQTKSIMIYMETIEGENILRRANIPTFPFPETAARVFDYMWKYSYNLRGIYETPSFVQDGNSQAPDRTTVGNIISHAREQKRILLNESESKQILEAYGMPTTPSRIADSEDEAVSVAHEIGYPAVLKLHSATITHKTDAGGVKLNLDSDKAVRKAYRDIEIAIINSAGAEHFEGVTVQPMISHFGYELIIGSSVDVQFGPVLLFGSGGQLVEVYRDRALALPPQNATLAHRMVAQTKIYQALQGARGRESVDLDALEELLITFSQLVVEQPWIKEIDINPLLACRGKPHDNDQPAFQALDARVVLYPAETGSDALSRPAIRPYPAHYTSQWTTPNGIPVKIRPIRPEDEPGMVAFHSSISDQSVYLRYFHYLNLNERVSHQRLSRLCFIDYDREMALVVEHQNHQTGKTEIIAVGRLVKLHNNNEAEFAIVISDAYQKCGLGTKLLRQLVEIGRQEGVERIVADMLAENRGMQRACEIVGFRLHFDTDEHVVKAVIEL